MVHLSETVRTGLIALGERICSSRASWGRTPLRLPFAILLLIWLGMPCLGCTGKGPATTDPEAKLRLAKILELYEHYTSKMKRPPPDEKTFKDFVAKLPKDKKDELQLGDDVESLFVSPRDGKKYVIRYNLAYDRGSSNQAVAWEDTGKKGQRFVALTMGYVEEYDEASFKEYKR